MSAVLKNIAGMYFVFGSGFVASSVAAATRLETEQAIDLQDCAKAMGQGETTVESVANKSYAVCLIRKGQLQPDGSITGTTVSSGWPLTPTRRRFATREEAITHGGRFATRRASKSDPVGSGTAGHLGYYVIETDDPVNAAVNPDTGLTNPIQVPVEA